MITEGLTAAIPVEPGDTVVAVFATTSPPCTLRDLIAELTRERLATTNDYLACQDSLLDRSP